VATFTAFASSVIFEKLHFMATFGTFFLKNGSWLPESAVLSRAFHVFSSSIFYIFDRINRIYKIIYILIIL